MKQFWTARLPSILWLLAGSIASGGYVAYANFAVSSDSAAEHAADSPARWLAVAREAEGSGKSDMAAAAYGKVLELEPFCQEALVKRPLCLAACEDAEALAESMEALVLSHAKLAVTVFDAPQLAAFRDRPEFRLLLREARSQAVD